MIWRPLGQACVVAVLATLGCAGPAYDYVDLPPEKIAIVYRTMAESDQVYDEILKREKLLRTRRTGRVDPTRRKDRNRMDGDAIAGLLGIAGDAVDRQQAQMGRLHLVDPHTGETEVADWAPRGAWPGGWSRDRTKLLYLVTRRGGSHVFERDFTKDESRQVTRRRVNFLDADYCGESGKIFGGIDKSGLARLFLRVDGGGTSRQVTKGPIAYAPSCTPDGKSVYYETLELNGQANIEVLDLTDPDAEPRRLTRGKRPVVTPDGAWVIYTVENRNTSKLWQMRPDGTGRHPLGRSQTGKWERTPSVSSDGKYVVFTATLSKTLVRPELWVRPLNGDLDRPLRVQGDALHPTW